jgi:Uma2 family endonuclease
MPRTRPLPDLHMTVEEFLAWDGGGHVGKLELVEGRVRAQMPASDAHATLQANVAGMIRAHLRATKSRCRVGTEAPVVPPMRPKRNARAPDVAVTCTPPSANRVYENPILIVEIMSPSNEDDTWDTISTLATNLSLNEIAIVQSETVEVQVFTRTADGNWPNEPVVSGPGGTAHLHALDLDLAVAEISERTLLEADATGAA